jgi:hypothetical protein
VSEGKPLFRLRGYPELERKLQDRVSSRLASWKAREPGLATSHRRAVERRPEGMRRSGYLQLRVLYRQFEEARAPGFPTLVRAARFLARRLGLGRWRGRA